MNIPQASVPFQDGAEGSAPPYYPANGTLFEHSSRLRRDEELFRLARASVPTTGLTERLSGGADPAMEVLRRRGEALLALGRPEEARADLERAQRMCKARGERREGLLTDRAYYLAFAPAEDKPSRVDTILQGLREIDDRFEFVRTVCFAIEGGLKIEDHTWLHDAFVSASHYVSTSGLDFWRKRLEHAAGYQKALTPKAAESPDAEPPTVPSRSPRFQRSLESVRIAARSSEPALVLGETGSGKEVISRLIHSWSSRAAKPLIAVNCGAIPENLIEGELFGHVRGAFTGAERDRIGLFEAADGGSVLLDEIGDLPTQMQVKLLRFLDNYEVRRVGDSTVRRVDVRIIAATNRDLQQLVADGDFRSDLFYRLKVFRVDIPPLRERREDIPDLVRQFMLECSHSSLPLTVSDDLMQWFQDFDWPGNVRELRSVCSFLAARVYGRPQAVMADLPAEYAPPAETPLETVEATARFELEQRAFQRRQFERALRESGGNIQDAARVLRMGRNHLARRMRELGLRREDFRGKTVSRQGGAPGDLAPTRSSTVQPRVAATLSDGEAPAKDLGMA